MKKMLACLLYVSTVWSIREVTMQDSIFREYDIRGVVGTEFTLDASYQLGKSIAYYLKRKDPELKSMALGMDGRTHSPAIKDAIARALTDSGIDVTFIGVCTTPVLYFALYNLPVDGGLMITASHNPKEYNGIKICLGKQSVWGLQVQEIKRLFKEQKEVPAERKGTLNEYPLIPDYVRWLSNHFAHLKGMPLSAVVDCGNGAAGTVMPLLVKEMEWQNVRLLYEEVDGTYPNHEANPTDIENMQDVKRTLQESDIAIGIGLDGDCDRMDPMTKEGVLVPGDQLLALFSRQILKKNPGAGIVCEVKCSQAVIDLLQEWGAQFFMSPTGHAIIKDQMRAHNAVLGGELSCHFFFKDDYFGYDDGIYAMMRLFDLLVSSGKSLDELLAIFPKKVNTPEYFLPCDDDQKQAIVEKVKESFMQDHNADLITIDGVRAAFADGWGLVRASNTTPKLTMRFESDTEEGLRRIKELFVDKLSAYFDHDLLVKTVHL